MVLIGVSWFLLILYGCLMAGSFYALLSMKNIKRDNSDGIEPASIVIAMRNEAKHVERCLTSILGQDFPAERMEIIVVDDNSEDDTAELVKRFGMVGVQILQLDSNEGHGKKAAINKGILFSKHENIILTDADCVFNKKWLTSLVTYKKKNEAVMLVAPVMIEEKKSIFNVFQSLDFIAMQGMTMMGVHTGMLNMCNGANLMYDRSAFKQVKGFEGIDHLATGDDMLLMEKMAEAFPGRIKFCKSNEAIVETASSETVKAFMQQRIRWAGKSTVYKRIPIKATLLLVYLLNLLICSMLVASIFNHAFFLPWLGMTCCKTMLELPFMYHVCDFFNRKKLLWWFLPMQPFHHAYIVIAGFFGLAGKVEWKGRRV